MTPNFYTQFNFHPVIKLPDSYAVLDFSKDNINKLNSSQFSVGRYNEKRVNTYTTEQFTNTGRDIHMGVDLGAPAGTAVFNFYDGEIFLFGNIAIAGDYGPTLILRYHLKDNILFALYGHLSINSLSNKSVGQKIKRGEVIGWLGDKSINGGWPPHVHFQLSLKEPKDLNMPGVVAKSDRTLALEKYPDPRLILGPIY